MISSSAEPGSYTERQRPGLTTNVATALMAFFLIGAISLAIAIVPPESAMMPRCPIRSLTGFYCPGCGLLRALHAAAGGRLVESVSFNALPLLIAPFLPLFLKARSESRWIISAAMLVIAVLFGVIRNIPCHPFTMLAPHGE